LFVIVSITNTSKTFFLAYYYITNKLAKLFNFVIRKLTKYVFYNCLKVAVIYTNFIKGLKAIITACFIYNTKVKDKAKQ